MAKSSTPVGLSAEELGFLAGGPARAVDAALARLMDAGLVRVSRQGVVSAVHQNGYGATTGIEAHVLYLVQGAGRPMGMIAPQLVRGNEVASLRRSLADRGLVRRGGPGGGLRRIQPLLFVLAFGAFVGGFFEDLLFVPAGILLVLALVIRRDGLLTVLGKAALRHARANTRNRVEAVAVRGFLGTVGHQRVAELFGLPPGIVGTLPNGHRKKSTSDSGGAAYAGCAGSSSCSSSSCGSSSSCSSSSSSCSSSSSSSSCSSSSS